MDNEDDFAALRHIASWAVSGITLKLSGGNPSNGDVLTPVTGSEITGSGVDVSSCCQQQYGDTLLPW